METLEFETATFSVNQMRRTMTGVVVPWNAVGKWSTGEQWRFAKGSLKYGALKYIKFCDDHNEKMTLGQAIEAEETEQGLVMTFSVYPGPLGDRMLSMALNGIKTGLSVGVEFEANDLEDDPDFPGAHRVMMANFKHVSLVYKPAFTDSRLISVTASANPTDEGATGMPETETAPAQTPVYTFSAEQFEQLLTRLGNPQNGPEENAPQRQVVNPLASGTQVNEPLPYTFSYERGFRSGPQGYDFSTDLFNAVKGDYEARERASKWIEAQFDTDRADVTALNPNIQRPDMYVDQQDYVTPLWDFVNRGTLADSTPFVVPKFNTSSGLVGPHTEGTEPAVGAFTATSQTITPTMVSGKVELTREAFDQGGNPQVSGLIWRQMLREYAEDREAYIATFLNTLTAATDIALPAGTGTNQAAVGRALEAAFASLQFARGGNTFRAFAVQQDLYEDLAAAEDDNGRPLYPILAPQNANGTAASLFRTLNIAGSTGVPSWALAAGGQTAAANSWLFDPGYVHAWASAPKRLDWNFGATVQTANIPQVAYVTIGIHGYVATANTNIAGVRQVTYDPVA